MRSFLLSLLIMFPAAVFAAKPQVKKAAVTAPQVLSAPAPDPNYCIFGAQSGKPFESEAAFRSVIWKSDVIYLAAARDMAIDPKVALEVLKALKVARASKIAVVFEALDATLQPALDDLLSGKMTGADFAAKAGAGFDFALYKPVFDFAIQNKLRVLAPGLPQKIAAEIARSGLAGLNENDRKLVPEQTTLIKNKKYLERLKASFGVPGVNKASFGVPGVNPAPNAPSWDYYLESVSAASETIGAAITGFLNSNSGWSMVVAAERERVIYNAAIPASVRNRDRKIRQASFYAVNAPRCPAAFPAEAKDLANYVWYIAGGTTTAK